MGKGHASPSDGNAYATDPRQMEFCRKAGPGINTCALANRVLANVQMK